MRLPRPPALESLFVATFALLGVRIGAQPIDDNSAFVHLRTGLDIVRTGAIPRVDPYSFTAAGHPWVVQSWLPEVLMGWAHSFGGGGVVVLQSALMAIAMGLVAALSRTGSPRRTLLVAGIAISLGGTAWSPRPLLVALICIGLTIAAVERGWRAWWLVPVGWVWVNSHGSFPLGFAWLALVAAGAWLDGERGTAGTIGRVARSAAALAAGVVIGSAAPLGFRSLTFPVTALERREVFRRVVEWRAPAFDGATLLVLLALVAAVVIVARAGTRPWRDLLPAAAFVAAGLFAQRNLAVAGVVLAPILARALMAESRESDERPPLAHLGLAAVLALVALAFAATAARGPLLDERRYPVAAARFLRDEGHLDGRTRIAHPDTAGCWLLLTQRVPVFIDDRYDMYPVAIARDYFELLDGTGKSLAILEEHDIEVVLWTADASLPAILEASDAWRRAFFDDDWTVFVRT